VAQASDLRRVRLKVRRQRPNDEKRWSRCKELLPISDFPRNAARVDHREILLPSVQASDPEPRQSAERREGAANQ
jgi:hypothetical protein